MTRHNLMHFKELGVASLQPMGEGGREGGRGEGQAGEKRGEGY